MRSSAIGLAIFLASAPAAAGLMQPNGNPIPTGISCDGGKPGGLAAVFACACTMPGVCNIGAVCTGPNNCDPGTNGTCETTIWHSFNDNTCIPSNQSGLDPVAEASITPETYHPSCPLTFDLLSRGTAIFKNAFGWYNATGQKPAPSDLHVMQDCNATPGQSVVLDLSQQPAYLGGDIGFFLVNPESQTQHGTCANGDCCATVARTQNGEGYIYYSQLEYNPDFAAKPYIHMLTYQSHLSKQKFYFAWEDTFQSTSGNFTDFVAAVSGVQCSGGGVTCDTGKKGICATGITTCAQATVTCTQVFQPGAETCNGLDDNCDGQIDEGAICPSNQICKNGSCVPHCDTGEFPCKGNTVCDAASGLCLDAQCASVMCPAGQICTMGACRTPCAGVVCPQGQTCVDDACVDLCKGVSCAAGQVCREGKCFSGCAACDGISCQSPLKCQSMTGACVDPSCPAGCPAGKICQMGQCVDACTGVVCPPGQKCSAGECSGGAAGTGGGAVFGTGGSSSTGSGGGGTGGVSGSAPPAVHSGCGCGAATAQRSGLGMAMMAMILCVPSLRRRPRRARASR